MLSITEYFAQNYSNFIWLAVFILALIPITEGRVAFTFAINKTLLKQNAISPILAILTCFLASIFLTLFLLVFFKSICKVLKKISFFNKFLTKIDSTIKNKSEKLKNKTNKYLYLFLFVLIPLPLTGVWSGSLISSFLNLDFLKSTISIVLGNLCSLILIYILSCYFKDFTLPIILIIFIIVILFMVIKKIINNKKNKTK